MASIKKDPKTGTWYFRVSYKDSEGKYRTKTKKGFKTKLEAQTQAGLLESKKQEQPDLSNERDLSIFAEYFEEWVETYITGKHSLGTDKKYEHEVELVKEFFKDTKLKDLTRTQYQSYINFRGKNRSKNTVQKTNGYLKKCLSYAIADGLIKSDPSFGVVLHYDVEEQNKVKYLDQAEVDKLLPKLEQSENVKDLMLYICLTTGLRIGEVFGLAYEDVTLNTLTVNRGYDYKDAFSFTPGKTKSSIRTIAINKVLHSKLQKFKIANQLNNKDYPFLNKRNRPVITYQSVNKHLKKLCTQLKITEITIHALRHTHASILLYNNFNIGYISKRLGHANISETLNTYMHIVKELEQTQNNQIADVFSAKKVQK